MIALLPFLKPRLFANAATTEITAKRFFRKHVQEYYGSKDVGRSVQVTGTKSINYAYTTLKNILRDCNVRSQFRMQARFESNPARKRRLRRERHWKTYLIGLKAQVGKAHDLKNRLQIEKEHHRPI